MTDLIAKQTVLDVLDEIESEVADGLGYQYAKWREYIAELPVAQQDVKQQATGSSDLISRQAVYDVIDKILEKYDPVEADNWYGMIRDEVRTLPSAQPERKKGHWTSDFCSVCGISKYNWFTVVSDKSRPFGTWNFCPGCGADMRKENK